MKEFDLDTPLLQFSNTGNNSAWTIRNAVEGVQIFGGIGSGKTSGSGRTLAIKYLKEGFGGLVLTAKQDEKDVWEQYCKEAGREKDLMVIEPGGQYSFDFLEYLSTHKDKDTGTTDNILETLKTVIHAGDEKTSGKSNDPFWESSLDLLLYHTIDLCKLSKGQLGVTELYEIVQTLPKPEGAAKSENEIS